MTTKDIIKILPFEQEYKSKLLEEFDSLTPDQKFKVEQILWRGYRTYYKMRLDKNLQLAFGRVNQKQEKLDPEFYKRVREQTTNELQQETSQVTTAVDLSETREELKGILENKAGKNSPKSPRTS